jgi:DeoR/GlpR family transcriptional regulator of sugar metabolism
MLAKERQNRILSTIKSDGSVRMSDIMQTFQVSHETARRDLDALQDQDLIKRVYGGAVLPDEASSVITAHVERKSSGTEERSAIGKLAASMIKDGDTVFLSVGLTVQEIAKQLRHRKDVTVLTNSVLVLHELLDSDVKLCVLGGFVNNQERSIEGSLALDTLSKFYVNKAFIGAGGISTELGISDYSLEVASLNCKVIEQSKKTILVAHAKKFGNNCLSITAPINKVQTIISDVGLSAPYQEYIKKSGVELLLADAETL